MVRWLLVLAACVVVAACVDAIAGARCTADADCPSTTVCQLGLCVAVEGEDDVGEGEGDAVVGEGEGDAVVGEGEGDGEGEGEGDGEGEGEGVGEGEGEGEGEVICVDQTVDEVKTGLLAATIDAWWQQTGGLGGARAPVPLFEGDLRPGDRLRLSSSSGTSICRTFSNQVGCSHPCPEQWKLFFIDAGGAVLLGQPEDVAAFATDVVVPDTAVRAVIGFRDDESFQSDCLSRGKCCITGQSCVQESIYFDNEGLRAPPNGASTGGCTLSFARTRRVCP